MTKNEYVRTLSTLGLECGFHQRVTFELSCFAIQCSDLKYRLSGQIEGQRKLRCNLFLEINYANGLGQRN